MNTQEVSNYIFLDDKNPKGDIAFVFGTWNSWEASVVRAAELYKNKLVPKVIVSGGKNPHSGIIEANLMARELEDLGVLKKDILIENESTNTLENVLFSKKIIAHQIGLENIKTICAVVKNYHARRALMTLRKHFPEHIDMKAVAYTSPHYPFSKDNWHEIDFGKEKVMGEIAKIEKYLKKGDLAKLP